LDCDVREAYNNNIGQLKSAQGLESDKTTLRLNEQFGYGYDKAWNLNSRTNNGLVQSFQPNSLNELATASRTGTLTVAGAFEQASASPTVSVSGTGLSTGAASVYADGTWARPGAALADGNNSYTATVTDSHGTSADTVAVNLPVSVSYIYDVRGNLTSDGLRSFSYDAENQLTNVTVVGSWRSDFAYDGLMRRRVRKEYTWNGGDWTLSAAVHYIYDGNLVIQERDGNDAPLVTYTRGLDISGSLEGAGGIGGLLARTDNTLLNTQPLSSHAYYHCDGNGNVTCLINAGNELWPATHTIPMETSWPRAVPWLTRIFTAFPAKNAIPIQGSCITSIASMTRICRGG
jgi:YD repeat-containing protein